MRTLTPGSKQFPSIETSYGDQTTPFVSAFASAAHGSWAGSIAGEFFRTDGFIIVDEAERGTVDLAANVERSVLVPFVERSFGDKDRIFASAEFFQEKRGNGTPQQRNDTHIRNFAAGADWSLTRRDLLNIRANGGTQDYNQTFSAVSSERSTESLNRVQRVPSTFFGVSSQWTGTYGRNILFAGFDVRSVRGHSDEIGFASGVPTSTSDAGGRELTNGIFGGAILPLGSRLTVSGGIRIDWWRNTGGFMRTMSLSSGAVTLTDFPDRSESAFSPRLSALYRLTDRVSVAANFSTGFRRPTLNELYRNFRVGDVLTLANADLRAERASGFDAAAIVNAFKQRLYVRAGMFCTSISENVSNVTLNVTPSLITRQRMNVGRTRSCGAEADWSFVAADDLRISGGYLFVDSRTVSFPANPTQEGLRIPQVARHQFSLQLAYSAPRIATLAAQIRAAGSQFDDDLNQFRLASFTTVDLFVSRKISSKVEVFAATENLFDSKIEAGRTPVLTLGTPRTFRIGLRLKFGRN